METTLVLLKPSCVQRQLIGEVVNRFERRGLRISGMKMMQLSDEILREHYAHLADKPFFPSLQASARGGFSLEWGGCREGGSSDGRCHQWS